MTRWVAGVSMALLSSFLSSLGFVLQRRAFLETEAEQDSSKSACTKTVFLAGVFIYISAVVPDLLAYGLIPTGVVSTLYCSRVIVNAALAHHILLETVSSNEICAMTVCVFGMMLCVGFGPKEDDDFKVTDTSMWFSHPNVWLYLNIMLVVLALLVIVEHADVIGLKLGLSHEWHRLSLPFAVGLAFALEKIFNRELGLHSDAGQSRTICFGIFIAVLGLLEFYLNLRAAQRLPVQVFVPVSFALTTVLQYFQSAVVMEEFRKQLPLQACISLVGAVVALVSALCMQPKGSHVELRDSHSPLPQEEPQDQGPKDLERPDMKAAEEGTSLRSAVVALVSALTISSQDGSHGKLEDGHQPLRTQAAVSEPLVH